MRIPLEDKYLAVKLAAWRGIAPRSAWAQYLQPQRELRTARDRDPVRWEIRALEEAGFSAKLLIEQSFARGVSWVEAHAPDGRAWVASLNRLSAAQIDAALAFPTPPAETTGA